MGAGNRRYVRLSDGAEVHAARYTGNPGVVLSFCGGAARSVSTPDPDGKGPPTVAVSLAGTLVSPGDWVVRGPGGVWSAVTHAEFAARHTILVQASGDAPMKTVMGV